LILVALCGHPKKLTAGSHCQSSLPELLFIEKHGACQHDDKAAGKWEKCGCILLLHSSEILSGSTHLLLALFPEILLGSLGETMRPDWCNFICLLIVLGFSGSKQASIDECAEAHRWSCILELCDNMPQIGYTVMPEDPFKVNKMLRRVCGLGFKVISKKSCFDSPGNAPWKLEAIGIPVVHNLTQ
jgi:hypothetical protein